MNNSIIDRLTTKQKIWILVGILIIVILIMILIGALITSDWGDANNSGDDTAGSSVTSGGVVDGGEDGAESGSGTTAGDGSNSDGGSNGTITGDGTTIEDRYGNVRTVDPNLLTTYFPYQVMREHDNEDVEETLRYFINVDEASKIINVTMEDCDIENDKKLVQQYIDAIPLDLSGYSIEYELMSINTYCGGEWNYSEDGVDY